MKPVFLSYRLSIRLLVGLALLLLLPSLNAGLMADDFWQAVWVTGLQNNPVDAPLSWFNLFAFADPDPATRQTLLEHGALTWWAASDLNVKFWRPVAELSHLDYRLFLKQPLFLHLHSLIWYGLLLSALAAFYRRILPHQRLVYWALLFVITEPFHAISVTWLANRNIIMAAFFALLCLIFYIDYRRYAQRWHLYAALFCLLLSLLCSEAGTSCLAFLIAYAVFLDKDRQLRSLIPFMVLLLLWFLLYKLLGYGAYGSAQMYVSPSARPLEFLSQYAQRLPWIMALQMLIWPKFWPNIFSPNVLMLLGSLLLIGLVSLAFYRKNRLLAFALCAYFISVLPLSAALLHERNFIFISIALAPILALFAQWLWQKSKLALAAFCLLRLVLCALLVPLACWYMMQISAQANKSYASLAQFTQGQPHNLFILGMPLMQSSFAYPALLLKQQTAPKLFNLSSKTDLMLEKHNGRWLISQSKGVLSSEDAFLRDRQLMPFQPRQTYHLADAQLRLDTINAQGQISQLSLQLHSANDWLLCWKANQVSPCQNSQ